MFDSPEAPDFVRRGIQFHVDQVLDTTGRRIRRTRDSRPIAREKPQQAGGQCTCISDPAEASRKLRTRDVLFGVRLARDGGVAELCRGDRRDLKWLLKDGPCDTCTKEAGNEVLS
jgi:hypothetical protein